MSNQVNNLRGAIKDERFARLQAEMDLREEDCCYRVTGGILRKNGGKKALDKVAKELEDMGYGRVIERSQVDVRKARP